MIEKFYRKLENDHNLQGYLVQAISGARDAEHQVEIILNIAALAGIELTPEEFHAYRKIGREKVTQLGFGE